MNEKPYANITELARPFGCSRQAITKAIKAYNLPYVNKYTLKNKSLSEKKAMYLPKPLMTKMQLR